MTRISALPETLRTSLAIHDDGNGKLKQEILIEALRCFHQASQNKFPIYLFNKDLRPDLEKLDKDKDGFLSIEEIGGVARKFNQQRNRLRDILCVGIAVVVFVILGLGAVMGLSYLALDLNKDVRASKDLLLNRQDGIVVKVSSSSYKIEGNSLNSVAEISSSVDQSQTVATSVLEYLFDKISADWPIQALAAVTKVLIVPKPIADAAGDNEKKPFIQAHVDYIVRLPNRAEINGDSAVLMQTRAGRFVVSGSAVQPAAGELATLDGAALHMEAVRMPSRRSLAVSGRRQAANQCNAVVRCRNSRRQETDCCDGQKFKCSTSKTPYSCDRGTFCLAAGSYTWCSDRTLVEVASNPYGCADTYTLQYNDVLDGPSLLGGKCALVAVGTTWQLISMSDYNNLDSRVPTVLGVAYTDPSDIYVKGVVAYRAAVNNAAKRGIYCPGNTEIVPGVWYAPPFLRKCSPGFYCYSPHFQFPCNNIQLTARPGFTAAAAYAGTYYPTTTAFNGHPVYLAYSRGDPCAAQGCGGAPVRAGLVYSSVYNPTQKVPGVYSIVPAASLAQVLSNSIQAASVAVATRNPASWSLTTGPTQDWAEFTGKWGQRTLADLICPSGSKLPVAGAFTR